MKQRLTREDLAALELGHTTVSRRVSVLLVLSFLCIIFSIPLLQSLEDFQSRSPSIVARISQLVRGEPVKTEQPEISLSALWSRNNKLLSRMSDFENELDKSGVLRKWLLAPGQRMLLALGYGNEKVYPGKDGWLFYRPDMDYLMGQEFLNPAILRQRRESGKVWEKTVHPNPIPAILAFKHQLSSRGITLILMPTPIKASLYPDYFVQQSSWHVPLQNRSWHDFVALMKQNSLPVFDPAPFLRQLAGESENPVYLKTDTHWRPEAMEMIARRLSFMVQSTVSLKKNIVHYQRQTRQVQNIGDIDGMLRLPVSWRKFKDESVTIHPVVTKADELWQPDPEAEVLLLGDSFSNIYSLAGMGWGEGSGLGEQLSYFLDRPVDLLLQNDAGAYATRELLARELARGRDRLAGKKVVIWQFASRELSSGDWKLLEMELQKRPESDFFVPEPGASLKVQGIVAAVSRSPQPGTVPYKDNIITLHLVDLTDIKSGRNYGQALVYCWGMRDNNLTRFARLRAGEEVMMNLVDWDSVSSEFSSYRRSTLDDEMLELELPVWGE